MKKILFFIAVLSAFISNAQVRQPQTLGSPMTDVYSKGTIGSDSGYVYRYNFPDTINIGLIKNIPGISIRVGNILYLRNQTASAWIQFGSGGGSSDTANLYIQRVGLGVPIWSENNDTLLFKDIKTEVFLLSDIDSDSSLRLRIDTANSDLHDYIKLWGLGIDGLTPGAVTFGGADGKITTDPTIFFYDNSTNFLALGHASPVARLDIRGNDNIALKLVNTAGSGDNAGAFISLGSDDGAAQAAGDRLGTFVATGNRAASTPTNSGSFEFFARSDFTGSSAETKLVISLTSAGQLERDSIVFILPNQNVGIGEAIGNPTAALHLRASSTNPGRGQLKFENGSLPTTPETGLMNFKDGLWFIDSSTSVRDTVATREWARAAGLGTGSSGGASTIVVTDTLLTSGTSFTTPSDITTSTVFLIKLVGGGGGGGGMNTTNAKAAGGGAGGALYVSVSGLSPSTAYTYAIGAAGTAGAATPTAGGNGGNTTLTINGVTYTGNGGIGGSETVSASGGAGGTATNGDINITGQNGDGTGGASSAVAGAAGGTPGLGWGMGGAASDNSGNGLAATGYGGGGGGGVSGSATGGAGTQGAIFIQWIVGSGGGGSGSVTNVATGLGLSGGPITTTGTIIADTSYLVNKSTAQVISGAKNFTSAAIKLSGIATDNTATKFLVQATDGTVGTQTIQTISAYTSVDSLMSGQYTPTLANVTNVAGTTAVLVNYQKIGSIVHVQGVGSCTVTASGGTLTTMSITLPFASAMTLVTDCSGSGTARTSAAALPAYVATNTTTDVAEVSFYSGSGSHDVHFSFTYKVK